MARRFRSSSWLRDHGLLLALLGIFVATLGAMVVTGAAVASEEQLDHGGSPISPLAYLATPDFVEATFENWESEFLQMAAYVVLTAYLFQRGSAESKDPDATADVDEDPRHARVTAETPWPVRRGGLVLRLYEHSLLIFFAVLFLLAMALHAVGGAGAYSEEQLQHGGEAVTVLEYLGTAQFWFESMQNWQSEFLAVAAIVWASIRLRERGSPESKPVAAPHSQTG
jgi:hypothetical protein